MKKTISLKTNSKYISVPFMPSEDVNLEFHLLAGKKVPVLGEITFEPSFDIKLKKGKWGTIIMSKSTFKLIQSLFKNSTFE